MKKTILLVFVVCSLVLNVQAQKNYNTGVGLKFGLPSGINVKHFVGETAAVEGVLGWWNYGWALTGYYEIHNAVFDNPDFVLYYGPGAHIGTYDHGKYNNDLILGVDGIIGVEYTIPNAPITFGLDLAPGLNFAPDIDLWLGTGLSIRYVFK